MNYNKSGANPLNVSYAPVNDQLVIAINQNRESKTRLTRRIYQQTKLNRFYQKEEIRLLIDDREACAIVASSTLKDVCCRAHCATTAIVLPHRD